MSETASSNFIVYEHLTPSNKRYFGITSQPLSKRWKNGLGYSKNDHFYRAIQKYGWDNIQHDIIAIDLSKHDACLIEQTMIAYYNTTDEHYGYNKSIGGEAGCLGAHTPKSAETRHKMSVAQKEIQKSLRLAPEWHIKMSHAKTGKNYLGTNSNHKNPVATDSRNKPVLQYSLDGQFLIEYPSASFAGTALNICYQNIQKCCAGERMTAGGYIWKYKLGGDANV